MPKKAEASATVNPVCTSDSKKPEYMSPTKSYPGQLDGGLDHSLPVTSIASPGTASSGSAAESR
jgi:hypothetical protein